MAFNIGNIFTQAWETVFPSTEKEKELDTKIEKLKTSEGIITGKFKPSENIEEYKSLLDEIKKDKPEFDLNNVPSYRETIEKWHNDTINNIKPLQFDIQVEPIKNEELKQDTKNTLKYIDSKVAEVPVKTDFENILEGGKVKSNIDFGSEFLQDFSRELSKKTITAANVFGNKYSTENDNANLRTWNTLSKVVMDEVFNDVRSGNYNPKETSFANYAQKKRDEGYENLDALMDMQSSMEEDMSLAKQWGGENVLDYIAGAYGETLGRVGSGLQMGQNIAGRALGLERYSNEFIKDLDNERSVALTEGDIKKSFVRLKNGVINVLENAPEIFEVVAGSVLTKSLAPAAISTTFLKSSTLGKNVLLNLERLESTLAPVKNTIANLDKALSQTKYIGGLYKGLSTVVSTIPKAINENLIQNLSFANAAGANYSTNDFFIDLLFDNPVEAYAKFYKGTKEISNFKDVDNMLKEATSFTGKISEELNLNGFAKRVEGNIEDLAKKQGTSVSELSKTNEGKETLKKIRLEVLKDEAIKQFSDTKIIKERVNSFKIMEDAISKAKTEMDKDLIVSIYLKQYEDLIKQTPSEVGDFQNIEQILNSPYRVKKRVFDEIVKSQNKEAVKLNKQLKSGEVNIEELFSDKNSILKRLLVNGEEKAMVVLLYNLAGLTSKGDKSAKIMLKKMVEESSNINKIREGLLEQGQRKADSQLTIKFTPKFTTTAKLMFDGYNKGSGKELQKASVNWGLLRYKKIDILNEGGVVGIKGMLAGLFTDVSKAGASAMRALKKNILVHEAINAFKGAKNIPKKREALESSIKKLRLDTIGEDLEELSHFNKVVADAIKGEEQAFRSFDNRIKGIKYDKGYIEEAIAFLEDFVIHLNGDGKNIKGETRSIAEDFSNRIKGFKKATEAVKAKGTAEEIEMSQKFIDRGLKQIEESYKGLQSINNSFIEKTVSKKATKPIEEGQKNINTAMGKRLQKLNNDNFNLEEAYKVFNGIFFRNSKGQTINAIDVNIGGGIINWSQAHKIVNKLVGAPKKLNDLKKAKLLVSSFSDMSRKEIKEHIPLEDLDTMEKAMVKLLEDKDMGFESFYSQYRDILMSTAMDSSIKSWVINNKIVQESISTYNEVIRKEVDKMINEQFSGIPSIITTGIDAIKNNPVFKKLLNVHSYIVNMKAQYLLENAVYQEAMKNIRKFVFKDRNGLPVNLRKLLTEPEKLYGDLNIPLTDKRIKYLTEVIGVNNDGKEVTLENIKDFLTIVDTIYKIGLDFISNNRIVVSNYKEIIPEIITGNNSVDNIEKTFERLLSRTNLNTNLKVIVDGVEKSGEEALEILTSKNPGIQKELINDFNFRPMVKNMRLYEKFMTSTRKFAAIAFEWVKTIQQVLHPTIDFLNKQFALKVLKDKHINLLSKKDLEAAASIITDTLNKRAAFPIEIKLPDGTSREISSSIHIPVQAGNAGLESIGAIGSAASYNNWWRKAISQVPEERVNEVYAKVLTYQHLQLASLDMLGEGGLEQLKKVYDQADPLFKRELERRLENIVTASYIDTARKMGASVNDPLMRAGIQKHIWWNFMKVWATKQLSRTISDLGTPIIKFIRSGDISYVKDALSSKEVMEDVIQLLVAAKIMNQGERYWDDSNDIDYKKMSYLFNPLFVGAQTAWNFFIPDNAYRKMMVDNGQALEVKTTFFLTDMFKTILRNLGGAEIPFMEAVRDSINYSLKEEKTDRFNIKELLVNQLFETTFGMALPVDRSVKNVYGFNPRSVVDKDTSDVLSFFNTPALSEKYMNEWVLDEVMSNQLEEYYLSYKKGDSNIVSFAVNRAWGSLLARFALFSRDREYSYRNNIGFSRLKTMMETDPNYEKIKTGDISELMVGDSPSVDWRDIKTYITTARSSGLGGGLLPTNNLELLGLANIDGITDSDSAMITKLDGTPEWEMVMTLAKKTIDAGDFTSKEIKTGKDVAINSALLNLSNKIGSKALAAKLVLSAALTKARSDAKKEKGMELTGNETEAIEKNLLVLFSETLVKDVDEKGEVLINKDLLGFLAGRYFYRTQILDKVAKERELTAEEVDRLTGYSSNNIAQLAQLYMTVDIMAKDGDVLPANMLNFFSLKAKVLQGSISDKTSPEILNEYAQSVYNISKFIKTDSELLSSEKSQMIQGLMLGNYEELEKILDTPYGEMTKNLNETELSDLAKLIFSESTANLEGFATKGGGGKLSRGATAKLQSLRLKAAQNLVSRGITPKLQQPIGFSFARQDFNDTIKAESLPSIDIVELINPTSQNDTRRFISDIARGSVLSKDLTSKQPTRKSTKLSKQPKLKFKFIKPKSKPKPKPAKKSSR